MIVLPRLVSITRSDPVRTYADVVRYVVTFSETVTGVDPSGFTLTTQGITGAQVTRVDAVPGSNGTQYVVSVGTGSGNGTLSLNLIGEAIRDTDGNPLPAGDFSDLTHYAAAGETSSIAVADLDGDGDLDLVTGNRSQGSYSVLLGNGDGTFRAAVTRTAPLEARYVVLGDVNRDNRPDLVISDGQSGYLSLGNGDGTFRSAVSLGSGGTVIADINLDGNPDIVGVGQVLLGNGDGTFRLGNYATTGPSVVVDFNGDARPDIATVSGQNTGLISLGNGDGTFQDAISFETGIGSRGIASADLNGDGFADLVTADVGSPFPYPFGTPGGISVMLGRGDGGFAKPVTYASGSQYLTTSTSVQLADLDGDGVVDIADLDTRGARVKVLLGNGDGTFRDRSDFTTRLGNPLDLALGDFNGDGRPDLAATDQGNTVSVLLNGLPVFGSDGYIVRPTSRFIHDGDFSGDGLGDLAFDRFGELILWNRDSSGFSAVKVPGELGLSWKAAGLGDFNGDGHVDVTWADAKAGTLAIEELNGANVVGFGVATGRMGPEWHVAAVADLDRDGKSDVLWQNKVGMLTVWKMNGTDLSDFGVGTAYMGENWNVVGVGNFHGSGGQDVLWHSAFGDVATWSMKGANLTEYTALGHMGTEWRFAGTGDFNRDGTADMVWVDTANHVQIWNMNAGRVGSIVNPDGLYGTEWHLEAVGDFTGGGATDLLWITEAGATAIWHVDGSHVDARQVNAPHTDYLVL